MSKVAKDTCVQNLALTLVLVMMSGCSTLGPTDTEPREPAPIESSEPIGPAAPDAASSGPLTPAIPSPATPPVSDTPEQQPTSSTENSLVRRAAAATAMGDYDHALVLLERAQRIDPTNADIYLALVRTYSAKGDTRLARVTAERGLLYCRNTRQCDQLRAFAE